MEVKHYKDPTGTWFREIVSHHYKALKDLQAEYTKRGKRSWFNMYDACNGQWMLTVQIGRQEI